MPAARRLLSDMGLLESFLTEGHQPWYGRRSIWGDPETQEIDFVRDPDGHGWHLDRARFEQWLRNTAIACGANLLNPATFNNIEHDGRKWQVLLQTTTGPVCLTADVLIDAGGRSIPVARKLGVRSQTSDSLICAWLYGRDSYDRGRGLTYVEAVETGWWYTAPLPGHRRVLAFHTDADLPIVQMMRKRDGLLESVKSAAGLTNLLEEVGFVPESEKGMTAAHSALLDLPAGKNWLAVGDAAISFDPLSSQGLLNALFTGLAAAEATDRHLQGDTSALAEYPQLIRGIGDAYQKHLISSYAAEKRWPESPFWQRRHKLVPREFVR